jgi:glycosyltransferase involved in cell wall biosynthesis
MDYRPNIDGIVWFATAVWPNILRQLPNARLFVIGRNPTRKVRTLARMKGITVTGEVRDPSRYVARCRLMIAPLRLVRGIPNKVLESMATRRPVLATPEVAASLNALPGRHQAVADEPTRFAAQAIDLCCIDSYARRLAAAGHEFVATRFSWPDALDTFERIVLGESSRRTATAPEAVVRQSARNRQPMRLRAWPGSEAVQIQST